MELDPGRERLRFTEFAHHTSPNGRAHVRVVLTLRGAVHAGEATGLETREGAARAAAGATLAAVREAAGGRFHAELLGLKLVRAFDAWIVVTALRASDGTGTDRLLGSAEAPGDDTARGAVRSVLDAVNRVLGRHVAGLE